MYSQREVPGRAEERGDSEVMEQGDGERKRRKRREREKRKGGIKGGKEEGKKEGRDRGREGERVAVRGELTGRATRSLLSIFSSVRWTHSHIVAGISVTLLYLHHTHHTLFIHNSNC